MGTHVTLVTSEIYALNDLRDYAMKRLRIFSNLTKINGAFTQYNSPTYTIVALEELGRLRMHAIGNEVKTLANELYYICWKDIAEHYHVPTGQWSGPHSRSYRTLLSADITNFIWRSFNNTWDPRLPLPIPDDLKGYFSLNIKTPRTLAKTYSKDSSGVLRDLIGTTYMHSLFTIGSASRSEMWNQRRPLIAYWGTKQKPSYLQLRFLHDGYDFADAQFYSVQKDNRVLAGLVLATNGGDTHISTLIKNATIKAKDLRIRFEIGGNDVNKTWQAIQNLTESTKIIFDNIALQFSLPAVRFSNRNGAGWTITRDNTRVNIDYVLFTSNVEQTIILDTLAEAALFVAVQFSTDKNGSIQQSVVVSQGTMLQVKWASMCLSIPIKPAPVSQLRKLPKYICS